MDKKTVTLLTRILFDSELVISRLLLGCAELLWFGALCFPGVFKRPTYALMSNMMDQWVWALVFLVSGITQISIVLHEKFHTRFARWFAGWNACLWIFSSVAMLFSVYPPPAAVSGDIVLGAVALWIWVRPYIVYEGIARARANR